MDIYDSIRDVERHLVQHTKPVSRHINEVALKLLKHTETLDRDAKLAKINKDIHFLSLPYYKVELAKVAEFGWQGPIEKINSRMKPTFELENDQKKDLKRKED